MVIRRNTVRGESAIKRSLIIILLVLPAVVIVLFTVLLVLQVVLSRYAAG